ncbi:hypothetical protein HDU93_005208 [Gonapodya sp. JEL0774]|nr:hypothetical protein HDU93_005208 [Gonapodya sp. JEL0774]
MDNCSKDTGDGDDTFNSMYNQACVSPDVIRVSNKREESFPSGSDSGTRVDPAETTGYHMDLRSPIQTIDYAKENGALQTTTTLVAENNFDDKRKSNSNFENGETDENAPRNLQSSLQHSEKLGLDKLPAALYKPAPAFHREQILKSALEGHLATAQVAPTSVWDSQRVAEERELGEKQGVPGSVMMERRKQHSGEATEAQEDDGGELPPQFMPPPAVHGPSIFEEATCSKVEPLEPFLTPKARPDRIQSGESSETLLDPFENGSDPIPHMPPNVVRHPLKPELLVAEPLKYDESPHEKLERDGKPKTRSQVINAKNVLFSVLIDTLEDEMNAQAPPFVQNLRVADFELGPHAPRITSIQAYPEASGEDSVLMDVTMSLQPPVTAIGSGAVGMLNTHFLITGFLGSAQVGGVTVPILVEQAGFEAKARVQIILSSSPPFAKELRLSLLDMPFLDIAIRPLKLINLMNFPIISQFVMSSMEAAISQLAVTPHVLRVDLETLLTGKEVSYDVNSVGVVEVVIHEAIDNKKADTMSENDTYVTISFGGSRTLARTRIINNSAHPVWEETHFVLVSEDDVKAGSAMSLALWDYDAVTPDDLLGKVNIPVADVVDADGLVHSGWLNIVGKNGQPGDFGKLHCDVFFHPKACTKDEKETLGVDCKCDEELDESATSGILALTIHQAMDVMVRPKHDVVIGSVIIVLDDIFRVKPKTRREHTAWYPLTGGVGFGKIRLSLVIRAVHVQLPMNMRGFEVGTFTISGLSGKNLANMRLHSSSQALSTFVRITFPLASRTETCKHKSTKRVTDNDPAWISMESEVVAFRCLTRYQSIIRLEVISRSHRVIGVTDLWLQDLIDSRDECVMLPLNDPTDDTAATATDRSPKASWSGKRTVEDVVTRPVRYPGQRRERGVVRTTSHFNVRGSNHSTATSSSRSTSRSTSRSDMIMQNREEREGKKRWLDTKGFVATRSPETVDDQKSDEIEKWNGAKQHHESSYLASSAEWGEHTVDSRRSESAAAFDLGDKSGAGLKRPLESESSTSFRDAHSSLSELGKHMPFSRVRSRSRHSPDQIEDRIFGKWNGIVTSMNEIVRGSPSEEGATIEHEGEVLAVCPEISRGQPLLILTCRFEPGLRWIESLREAEEYEIETFEQSEPVEAKARRIASEKKSRGWRALLSAPGTNVTNRDSEGGTAKGVSANTQSDKVLPGNSFTRSLDWAKDQAIDWAKATRIWKRSQAHHIPEIPVE